MDVEDSSGQCPNVLWMLQRWFPLLPCCHCELTLVTTACLVFTMTHDLVVVSMIFFAVAELTVEHSLCRLMITTCTDITFSPARFDGVTACFRLFMEFY